MLRIASYGPQIDQSHGENRLSHIIIYFGEPHSNLHPGVYCLWMRIINISEWWHSWCNLYFTNKQPRLYETVSNFPYCGDIRGSIKAHFYHVKKTIDYVSYSASDPHKRRSAHIERLDPSSTFQSSYEWVWLVNTRQFTCLNDFHVLDISNFRLVKANLFCQKNVNAWKIIYKTYLGKASGLVESEKLLIAEGRKEVLTLLKKLTHRNHGSVNKRNIMFQFG